MSQTVEEFRIEEDRILAKLIITSLRGKYPSVAPCIAEEKWRTYIAENYILKHTELFQVLDCVEI